MKTVYKTMGFSLGFALCAGTSMPMTSYAQAINDPFATNVIAPTEPTDLQTAPVPVAPKLPPLPVKKEVIKKLPAPTTPVVPASPAFLKPKASPKPIVSQEALAPVGVQNTTIPTPAPLMPTQAAVQTNDPFSPHYVAPSDIKDTFEAAPAPAHTKNIANSLKEIKTPEVKTNASQSPVTKTTSVENNTNFFERLGNFFKPQTEPTTPPTPVVEKVEPPVQAPIIENKATSSSQDTISNFFSDLFSKKENSDQPVAEVEKKIEATPKIKQDQPPVKKQPIEPKASDTNLFDRIGEFFQTSKEETNETKRKIVVSPTKTAVIEKPVEQKEPVKQVAKLVENPTHPLLLNSELGLGDNIKLGQSSDTLGKDASCFNKNRDTITYCLLPTTWPSEIARHFELSTPLLKGTQGIIQIEGNITSRLFTMFDVAGFNDIQVYFTKKFGPATHHFVRKTRSLSNGNVDNPVYLWRKEDKETGLIEILEIRKYTDVRRGIPDMKRSTVRVYFDGAREIFSIASDLDFMDLKR